MHLGRCAEASGIAALVASWLFVGALCSNLDEEATTMKSPAPGSAAPVLDDAFQILEEGADGIPNS